MKYANGILALCATLLAGCSADDAAIVACSPDGRNTVELRLVDGRPLWSATRDGQPLVTPSRLGFVLAQGDTLGTGLRHVGHVQRSVDEVWVQPWGECDTVRDRATEVRATFERDDRWPHRLEVTVRAGDDGVAFRLAIPEEAEGGELLVMDELSEFAFADDLEAWGVGAYQWNRYEYLTEHGPLSAIDSMHTPLTLRRADGAHFLLHEAALTDYASMALVRRGTTTLKADLVPWSDGVRVRAENGLVTPWRMLATGDDLGDLVESTLDLKLNEPSRIADPSWIRPMKYVGIWWEMHLFTKTWGSGPLHGATTERAMRLVDFAAEHGIGGVLVEGWNTGWDGDWIANGDIFSFTTPHPDFDIGEVVRYAKGKGVELIGHHETGAGVDNYERQLDAALSFYDSLGIHSIKTGYVGHGQAVKRIDENGVERREWHHGQYMVRHYRKVTEAAVARRMMLDVHEPIKDTGIRRTWPNLMTREGARGQEFNAWGEDGGNPPDHTVLLAQTRLLSGPMDYTPGIFELLFEKERPDNRVNSTLAHQLALYVVLYSPLQMLPDLPENYLARPEAFRFLLDVPVDWSETVGVAGEMGEYQVTARRERGGPDWYLGAITNGDGRELTLPLSFLDPATPYVAELYRDGEGADWKTDPYAFATVERPATAVDTLRLALAPGGGAAVRFRAVTGR